MYVTDLFSLATVSVVTHPVWQVLKLGFIWERKHLADPGATIGTRETLCQYPLNGIALGNHVVHRASFGADRLNLDDASNAVAIFQQDRVVITDNTEPRQ